ncbi:FMN-linked oxidoreductase [Mycena chlorophos]|uniref:FMN-linked oxidoreductase n=1 Tax=Mycena chlorophos TaxID=658473 RepID=A0A8H6TJ73_MYCCL|nr:FMN-linked oxidoreductase [Mycena chlorophos]
MFSFKFLVAFVALASVAVAAPSPDNDHGSVYTVTVEENTLVDYAPYFVTVTKVETFTASPSTSFAHPTGTFVTKAPAPPRTPRRMWIRDIEKAMAEFVRGAQLAEEVASNYMLLMDRRLNNIRLVVSPTFILGIKLNSTDSGVDALKHVQTIASWGRVDFIEVSGGDYESPDFLLEKSSRQALFADFSTHARESLASLPPEKRPLVLLTGGLSNPAQLRNALSAGHADLVGLGRTAVLCPDAPSRVRNNRPFPAQPTLDFHPLRARLPLPRIKLIGAGTTMAWYTVMLRRLAQGREVDFGMGPVGGLVWMWFWMGPDLPQTGFVMGVTYFGVLPSAVMLRLWVSRP